MSEPSSPRIYVASLSDYNAGRLHGVFIDDCTSSDAIHSAIQVMLANSREELAEEWAIHDYEGFGPVHLNEYEAIETVANLAAGIAEYGLAFAAWAAHIGSAQWDEDLPRFEDCYMGHYECARAFAEEMLDSLGVDDWQEDVPEMIREFVRFDVDAFAADLASHWVFVDADPGIYVFES